MYRTPTILLLILGFSFGMQIIAADGAKWELVKDSNGLKVYTRKSSKSSMKDAKAIMEVKGTPEQVVSIIRDFGNYQLWMDRCEKLEVIKKLTDNKYYMHYYTEAPWPVSDRDNTALWTLVKREGGEYFITIEADPDYIPATKDYVRIPYSYSTWTIKPNGSGGASIEHYNSAEAGGGMPGWMANMGVIDYPFNTLSGLAKEVERRF